jgi:hypothetical protein
VSPKVHQLDNAAFVFVAFQADTVGSKAEAKRDFTSAFSPQFFLA